MNLAEDRLIAGIRMQSLLPDLLESPQFVLDAKHYQDEFLLARRKIEAATCNKIRLAKLASVFVPNRLRLVTVASPKAGAPYLRAHDIFETRPESERFVSKQRSPDYDDLLLKDGMILTPSSGRNLGPIAYVGAALAGFAMTDIMRIVPSNRQVGFYLLAYLQTSVVQALIRRGRTGSNVDHLAPKTMEDIPVLWPSDKQVEDIATRVEAAADSIDSARLTLNSLEEEFHSKCGLDRTWTGYSDESERNRLETYSVGSEQLSLRIDAAFYGPRVRQARTAIGARASDNLCDVADLIMLGRYKRYYVSSEFGIPILSGRQLLQLHPVGLKSISARSFADIDRFKLREGMCVFTCDGRSEEALAAPAYVFKHWDGWLASNHVMRANPRSGVHPGFVYLALRSPYVQIQLKSRATGSVIDALDPPTVADVLVPRLSTTEENCLGQRSVEAWDKISRYIEDMKQLVKETESLFGG